MAPHKAGYFPFLMLHSVQILVPYVVRWRDKNNKRERERERKREKERHIKRHSSHTHPYFLSSLGVHEDDMSGSDVKCPLDLLPTVVPVNQGDVVHLYGVIKYTFYVII